MKSSMMLLVLTSVIAYSSAAKGFQLQSRTVQSLATCMSDFAWADNTRSESPCQVAAELNALCNNNQWIVPPINSSYSYKVPEGSTATFCTCSWASYNLISACQACQHFPEQISNWSPYIVNCGGKTSDTFFPRNLTIPQGTLIPFWATMDPTQWMNGERFNPAQAQDISKEGKSDLSAVPAPTSKSTPIGAIVGGVIGGIVVLLAATLVGICIFRRARLDKSQAYSNGGSLSLMQTANNTHSRSQSDFATNSHKLSTPMGYTSFSSILSRPPTSPTIRTQGTSSIRSFPFFSSRGSTVYSPPSMQQQLSPSVQHQSPPSLRAQSPPSLRQQSPSPVPGHRDETAVEPFVLPPNNPNPDRKQANGAYLTYDPPSAPPPTTSVRMDVRPTTPTQGGRTRYNPPAYTEKTKASVEAGGRSSPHRRPPQTGGQVHAKKGSADTQHSMTSSRSGAAGGVTRTGGNSATNVGNLLTPIRTAMIPQLNTHTASRSSNAVPTGHGRQLSGNTTSDTSMDGKRRPTDTEDSFSARDLA